MLNKSIHFFLNPNIWTEVYTVCGNRGALHCVIHIFCICVMMEKIPLGFNKTISSSVTTLGIQLNNWMRSHIHKYSHCQKLLKYKICFYPLTIMCGSHCVWFHVVNTISAWCLCVWSDIVLNLWACVKTSLCLSLWKKSGVCCVCTFCLVRAQVILSLISGVSRGEDRQYLISEWNAQVSTLCL